MSPLIASFCLVAPWPQQKRSKKKKKPRLPKAYDPTKPNGGLPPPDPERWLPKWQRSDAKKKKKMTRRERQQVGVGRQDSMTPAYQSARSWIAE